MSINMINIYWRFAMFGAHVNIHLIVTRVYAPRFFVSSQQKFGVTDIKAPWWVTALGGQTVL